MHMCNGEKGSGQTDFYGEQAINIRNRWLQNDFILEDCERGIHTKWFNGGAGGWASGSNVQDNDDFFEGEVFTENNTSVQAHWSAGVTFDIYKEIFGLVGMGGNYNGMRILVWHDSELETTPRFEG